MLLLRKRLSEVLALCLWGLTPTLSILPPFEIPVPNRSLARTATEKDLCLPQAISVGQPPTQKSAFSKQDLSLGTQFRRLKNADRLYPRPKFEDNRLTSQPSQTQLENIEAADRWWQKALSVYRQHSDAEKEARVLANLGELYLSQGKLESAIAYWQEFLTLVVRFEQPALASLALRKLGIAYQDLEDHRQAANYYRRSLALIQQLGDGSADLTVREAEAVVLGNLGLAYHNLGDYARALESYDTSLAQLKRLGNAKEAAKILANAGNLYAAVGEYEAAIERYRQSLALSAADENDETTAIVLGSLGTVHANLGETERAIACYRRGLAVARQNGDRVSVAHALNNLGLAYRDRGNWQAAIDAHQQSVAVAEELSLYGLKGINLSNLGLIYASQGDRERAIAFHQQSVAIAQAQNAPREEALALNNLAHALFEQGKLAAAEEHLRRAVRVLDSLRSGLSDVSHISIFDTQRFSYNLLQQVLIAQGRSEAALVASERSRTRAFAALLSERMDLAVQPSPPSLVEIRAIAKAYDATLVEYSIVPDDAFVHRGKLRGTAAQLYIWVISPSGEVTFRQVDLRDREGNFQGIDLEQLVRDSRTAIFEGEPSNPGLQRLYQLLIEPIADFLPTDPQARAIFIPQDSLFLIPFPALQDETGQYLIEKHAILTAPSIQILALNRQRHENRARETRSWREREILIVGNPTMPSFPRRLGEPPKPLEPLPDSEREAREIATLLKTQASIGPAATERAIAQRLPQAKIVHLATHGLLDELKHLGLGFPGAIALAPTESDDGLLSSSEIVNLNLSAELVVLSACDTGRGDLSGDGVIGLSRSFLAAGAASLVVSLWKVPDEATAELMTEFYQHLQQRQDKAQALQQAMLSAIQQQRSLEDWAAFTLIGEP